MLLTKGVTTGVPRRLRDLSPAFAGTTCLAVACPACMTLELARSCAPYVTTLINNCDIVPTISPGARFCKQRPPPCWALQHLSPGLAPGLQVDHTL